MSNYDMDSLFHPKVEIRDNVSKQSEGEYSPSADKGTNGIYQSVIRFVSWWQDPQHSYIDKWVCWLVDPVTNRGRIVDCPSSVGKPSPLQDMFFKLRNSESIQEQKKAEIFSRKHQYAAIIQVIKDKHYPELEGKLLVYRFGKKVFEKIEGEKKPIVGEPHEPFDLIDGKAFQLIITKQSGYNNYDQAKFIDKKIPLLLPVNEKGEMVSFETDGFKLQAINEKTPREVVFNFLKENSPDLSKYAYQEWDQDIHDYVNQVILAVTGKPSSTGFADVRNNAGKNAPGNNAPPKTGVSPASEKISSADISIEDLSVASEIDSLPDLDLPDIDDNKEDNFGLGGDLDEAIANL